MAVRSWFVGVAASAAVLAAILLMRGVGSERAEDVAAKALSERRPVDNVELPKHEVVRAEDAVVPVDRKLVESGSEAGQNQPSPRQSRPRQIDPVRIAEVAENGLLRGDALHSQFTREVLKGEEFADFVDGLETQERHDSELSEISQMYAQHARDLLASLDGNIELERAGCGRSLCAMSFRSPAGENVWQQLSSRVMGPTGLPAYAGSSATVELPSGLTEFRIIFSVNPDVRSVVAVGRP